MTRPDLMEIYPFVPFSWSWKRTHFLQNLCSHIPSKMDPSRPPRGSYTYHKELSPLGFGVVLLYHGHDDVGHGVMQLHDVLLRHSDQLRLPHDEVQVVNQLMVKYHLVVGGVTLQHNINFIIYTYIHIYIFIYFIGRPGVTWVCSVNTKNK